MIEHKNRVPGAGKANRKLITPEGGAAPFNAVVTFADEPTDAGTPVTKLMLDEFLAASGPTGGTATALTLAQAGFVLADGAPVRFKLHTAIVGAVTLAVGGTAAKPVTYLSGDANLAPAPAGSWLSTTYSATLDRYVLPSDPAAINVTVAAVPGTGAFTLTPLSPARQYACVAIDGNGRVLIMGGGNASGIPETAVERYDADDSKTTLTSLAVGKNYAASAADGNGCALIAGGYDGSGASAVVHKYDLAGVRTTLTALLTGRMRLAAAKDGNGNVLFGGGNYGNGYSTNNVEKYDASGTKTVMTTLAEARDYLAAATDGNGNVLFVGGGLTGSYSSAVDKYTAAGVRSTLSALTMARYGLAAATDGAGSVLVAGGNSGNRSAHVDKYDKTGVHTVLTALSVARQDIGAASDGLGNVVFGGGDDGNTARSAVVERFDTSGVKTIITALPTARYGMAAASNKPGQVLFAGGVASTGVNAVVEKIANINLTKSISVPMYALYKFQEHGTEQRAMSNPTSVTINTPNTGTIRFGGALTL